MSILHEIANLGEAEVMQESNRESSSFKVASGHMRIAVYLPENRIFLGIEPGFQYYLDKSIAIRCINRDTYVLPTQDPLTVLRLSFQGLDSQQSSGVKNILSQRAQLIFNKEEAKGLKSLWKTSMHIFKETKQATKNALRVSRSAVNETLSDYKPGFLVVSKIQCELRSLREYEYVQVLMGVGPIAKRTALRQGNLVAFDDTFLFTRKAESALCIEVWSRGDPAAPDVFEGTVALRLEEFMKSKQRNFRLKFLKDGPRGIVSLHVVFVKEKDVGVF